MFGPSVKSQLLTTLDLHLRQAAEDRRATREMLLEQLAMQERMHKATTELVESLSHSVTEQSASFNRYLDLVTPKGEPQVRMMNDAIEAKIEQDYMATRHPDVDLFANRPIEEQLVHADLLAQDLQDMIATIT